MSLFKQSIDLFLEKRKEFNINIDRNYITAFLFYKFLSDKTMQAIKSNPKRNLEEIHELLIYKYQYYIKEENSFEKIIESIKDNTFRIYDFQRIIIELVESAPRVNLNNSIYSHIDIFMDSIGNTSDEKEEYLKELMIDISEIKELNTREHYSLLFNRVINIQLYRNRTFRPLEDKGLFVELLYTINSNVQTIYLPHLDNQTVSNVINVSDHNLTIVGDTVKTDIKNIVTMNCIINERKFEIIKRDWLENSHDMNTYDALYTNFNIDFSRSYFYNETKEQLNYNDFLKVRKNIFNTLLNGINDTGVGLFILSKNLLRGLNIDETITQLINNNQIDTVLQVPSGESIIGNPNNVIVIINNDKASKEILFIDATRDKNTYREKYKLDDIDIKNIKKTIKTRELREGYSRCVSINELEKYEPLDVSHYIEKIKLKEKILSVEEIYNQLEDINKQIKEKENKVKSLLRFRHLIE